MNLAMLLAFWLALVAWSPCIARLLQTLTFEVGAERTISSITPLTPFSHMSFFPSRFPKLSAKKTYFQPLIHLVH